MDVNGEMIVGARDSVAAIASEIEVATSKIGDLVEMASKPRE